jgi:hypothetical protein
MPNPNPRSFLAMLRLDPPLERAPAELLRMDRGISVVLGRWSPRPPRSREPALGRLCPGAGRAEQTEAPVYLEVDPATEFITRRSHPATITGSSRSSEQGRSRRRDRAVARAPRAARTRDSEIFEKSLTRVDGHRSRHISSPRTTRTRSSTSAPSDLDRNTRSRLSETASGVAVAAAMDLGPERWRWWPWWWFQAGAACHPRARSGVFDGHVATSCSPLTASGRPCLFRIIVSRRRLLGAALTRCAGS